MLRVFCALLFLAASLGCASRSFSSDPALSSGSALSNTLSHNGVQLSLPPGWSFAPPKNRTENTSTDAGLRKAESTAVPSLPFELFRFYSRDSAVKGVCVYLGGGPSVRFSPNLQETGEGESQSVVSAFPGAKNLIEAAFLYSDALGPRGARGIKAENPGGRSESTGEKRYYIREVVSVSKRGMEKGFQEVRGGGVGGSVLSSGEQAEKSLFLRGRSMDGESRFLSLLVDEPSGFYLLETYGPAENPGSRETEIRKIFESFTLRSGNSEARRKESLGIDFLAVDDSWRWAGDRDNGFLLRGRVEDYAAEADVYVDRESGDGKQGKGEEAGTVLHTCIVNHLPKDIRVAVYPAAERGGMLRFEIDKNSKYYLEIYFPRLRSEEKLRELVRHESIVKLIEDSLRWDLPLEAT